MIRIVAPHFVAGAILSLGGYIVLAAPILHYMTGWTLLQVGMYCAKKKWTVKEVTP